MCQETILPQHVSRHQKKGPMSDLLKMHFHLTHLNSVIGEFKAFNYLCQMRGRIFIMLVNIMGAEKLTTWERDYKIDESLYRDIIILGDVSTYIKGEALHPRALKIGQKTNSTFCFVKTFQMPSCKSLSIFSVAPLWRLLPILCLVVLVFSKRIKNDFNFMRPKDNAWISGALNLQRWQQKMGKNFQH